MKVEFIRDVWPGAEIHERGRKCFGIHGDRAAIAGQLCRIDDLYFIRSKTNKYVPTRHDIVMGRIIYTSNDYYRVDLGGYAATLPCLSFLNATKKNRPVLEKNELVLCQLVRTDGDLVLSCAKEGLGRVDEIFPMEPWKVRMLYFSGHLARLGSRMNFKIAMAMNGFVWIEAAPRTRQEVLTALRSIE